MIALLVIDMQVGLFEGEPRFDAQGVIRRINAIINAVHEARGVVVFIQHEEEDHLQHGTPGWQLLPDLERTEKDVVVFKKASDAFYESELADVLKKHKVEQVVITGCATDFCVDTTIRAAASRDFEVVVAEDGHTTKDRAHLDAVSIIKHHNWMWKYLILPHSEVKVIPTENILEWLQTEALR